MRTSTRRIEAAVALLIAAAAATWTSACSDSPRDTADGGRIDVMVPDGGAGDAEDAGPAGLAPPAPAGLAVVGSDYMTTSVSIVSAAGELVRDDCINSGTGISGGPALALSGDVTLPSQPQRGNELWLIDRINAALTVIEASSCTVWRQVSVSTGFRANPHDLVVLSATKAYVTRYAKNLTSSGGLNGGDDILIVDPESGQALGRIDLAPFAAPAGDVVTQARPDRAVLAGGKVYVTLGSQDAQFAATGEGRVVIVDPATDHVAASLPLDGLKNCSGMTVSADQKTLYVACGGAFGEPDQRLQSGVALIDLTASPPAVTRVISSQAIGGRALNLFWVGAASATQTFAATFGDFGDPTNGVAAVSDEIFAFDPVTGHSSKLTMGGPYDLGIAVAGGGRLFVPDASATTPRIHVFDTTATPPSESAAFDPEPAHGLPPREVQWY